MDEDLIVKVYNFYSITHPSFVIPTNISTFDHRGYTLSMISFTIYGICFEPSINWLICLPERFFDTLLNNQLSDHNDNLTCQKNLLYFII